jgi:hypothetical protein
MPGVRRAPQRSIFVERDNPYELTAELPGLGEKTSKSTSPTAF